MKRRWESWTATIIYIYHTSGSKTESGFVPIDEFVYPFLTLELRIQQSKEAKEETPRSSTPDSEGSSSDSALYEDPYEPSAPEDIDADTHQARLARELEKAKETQLKQQQQQQQQPDEDTRPAEDYDQPWEWSSKERLSQAFAGILVNEYSIISSVTRCSTFSCTVVLELNRQG